MNDLISRQKAIDVINEDKIDLSNPAVAKVFRATGNFENAETQVMTCDRHIRFLKDLPSEQPESEDIAFWKNRARKYEEIAVKLIDEMARGATIDSVALTEKGIVFEKKKPIKKGAWIKMSDADGIYWACSECGESLPRFTYYERQFDSYRVRTPEIEMNYCWNCGANMKGEEDGRGKDL